MARSRGGGDGVRLFVAVDPPDAVRRALTAWLRSQRDVHAHVRSVPVEHLHLTMAFLGSRPPHELDAIADVVSTVGRTGSAMGLRTGPPVWLPPRGPRALAVEVHDDRGDLATLHRSLDDALADAIGRGEDRPLRPHITVGRRSSSEPMPRRGLSATPALNFAGEALTLYRSTLDPDGARYTVVERAPLT
ncbi:MAG: RNA 2',3'-cyclic phosphodiesterase [Solirubrobacteraceae bacterium]|nr:RNA 2',3'-cyclic phosphodiesterase [Solirubrobacteraceae bacterium]